MGLPNFSDLTAKQWAVLAAGAGLATWGAVDIYKQRRKRLHNEYLERHDADIRKIRAQEALEEWSPKTVREPTPEERCLTKYRKQGMTEREAFFACYKDRQPEGHGYASKPKKKTKKSIRSSKSRNAMNNASKKKSKTKTRKSILDRILASAYHAASVPRRRRRPAKRKLWIDRKVKRPGTLRRILERAGLIARKERIPLWVKRAGCKTPAEVYRKIFHRIPSPKAARLFQRRVCAARTFEDLPTSSGRHIIRIRKIGGRKVKVSIRGPGARKATRRNRGSSEPCYELWYGRPGHERREGRFTSMEQVDRRKKSLTSLEKPLGIYGTRFQIVDCTGTRVLRERNGSRLTTKRRAA